jgi:hypothetical protein
MEENKQFHPMFQNRPCWFPDMKVLVSDHCCHISHNEVTQELISSSWAGTGADTASLDPPNPTVILRTTTPFYPGGSHRPLCHLWSCDLKQCSVPSNMETIIQHLPHRNNERINWDKMFILLLVHSISGKINRFSLLSTYYALDSTYINRPNPHDHPTR